MVKQKCRTLSLAFILLTVSMMTAGCNSPDLEKTTANSSAISDAKIDLSLFGKDALVKAPVVVDCALTNGEASKCVQIAVKHKPDNLQIGPGSGGKPNFADAAKKLGVTEKALEQAMQDAGGPQADLAKVAKTLSVSEEALKTALPARSPKP
jgi:hypothetical protein